MRKEVFDQRGTLAYVAESDPPRMLEIVYTWPDGRKEVKYRRPANSTAALQMIKEVLTLQKKHGSECPYSYRNV